MSSDAESTQQVGDVDFAQIIPALVFRFSDDPFISRAQGRHPIADVALLEQSAAARSIQSSRQFRLNFGCGFALGDLSIVVHVKPLVLPVGLCRVSK